MNRLFLLLMLFLCFAPARAGQVSYSEARHAAARFMGREVKGAPGARQAQGQEPDAPYYIFSGDDGEGFVIVGGDSGLPSIIGYSLTGHIDASDLPPQLDSLLSSLTPAASAPAGVVRRQPTRSTEGGKVLPTATWGQDAPYNLECPYGSPTGCVTTAMAIVMKYYNWPPRGRGAADNAFEPELGEMSFDTDFDWDNMLDSYAGYPEESSYTEAQVKSVAKLMHACGTALQAAFTPGWMTSADIRDCVYSLRNYFYYDGNIGFAGTGSVDVDGDCGLSYIKSEIDADRPVIFAGSELAGYVGHAWVVDGYDANDMVHINWGWDGSANGFFAYPVSNGYMANMLVYNIMPAENWVDYGPWNIFIPGSLNIDVVDVKQNEYFNAYCYEVSCTNRFNYPTMDPVCSGVLAVALTDSNGRIKEILREMEIKEWYGDRLAGSYKLTGLKVTQAIAPTDRISLVYKPTGYSDWLPFANPPGVYTWRPVRGNTPKVANVQYEFLSKPFAYTTKSHNTEGAYLQTKPMASGAFDIYFQRPAGKEFMWLAVKEQTPIGMIFPKTYPNPLVYIDLPYQHNDMTYTVMAMAFNEEDLIQDWVEVEMPEAGTLSTLLSDDERVRCRRLRIKGDMNSDDFYYITYEMPLIKHLDLANVHVVTDQYNYFEDYMPDNALVRKRLQTIVLPSRLKGLGLESLRENSFKEIDIPASCGFIGLGAFWGNDGDFTDIRCHSTTPPEIQAGQSGNEEHMFNTRDYTNATLWVPTGTKDDYMSQPFVWHNFRRVKEFQPAGIRAIGAEIQEGPIEIFNLQGVKVYEGDSRPTYPLTDGLYLFRQSGTCGKLTVKN